MDAFITLAVIIGILWFVGKVLSGLDRTPWAPSATKRPPNSSPLCDSDESFYAKIHGVTHRNDDGTSRQAALRKCWPGERLLFIREPGNRFDSNAIRICREDGKQLGYVSADVAARNLAEQMDAGATVTAEISELTGGSGDKPTRGANILIRVKPAPPSSPQLAAAISEKKTRRRKKVKDGQPDLSS